MTSDDVLPGEGPRDSGGPDDGRAVDDILDGRRRAGTEDEMAVDRLVRALRAPGTAEELRGLEATTAAFVAARAAAAAPVLTVVGGRPRRSVTAGIAVATALATVALGGVAAAAYTGSLPRPLQVVAHDVIGAPAAPSDQQAAGPAAGSTTASRPSSGSGPAVTPGAPALLGLCTAFRDRGPSSAPTGSTAYRQLFAAARDAGTTIDGYCATVLPSSSHHPSATPGTRHSPTQHPATPRSSTPMAAPRSVVATGSGTRPSDAPSAGMLTTRSSAAGDKGVGR